MISSLRPSLFAWIAVPFKGSLRAVSHAWLACSLLAAARPAEAVLRPPALDSPPDTLQLLPNDARDFRVSRIAGHDLHQAGYYLGLASVPLLLLTPWIYDLAGAESPLRDGEDGFFFLTYVALPAVSGIMAAGNMVYARATRYHPEREFDITRSLIPALAIGLAAGKTFYYFTQADTHESDVLSPNVLTLLAFTEAFTLPLLRSQFRSASVFLDQVQVKVIGQGASVGYRWHLSSL